VTTVAIDLQKAPSANDSSAVSLAGRTPCCRRASRTSLSLDKVKADERRELSVSKALSVKSDADRNAPRAQSVG
jgi:hypothetical protein